MTRPWHDTVVLDLLAGYGAFIVLAIAMLTLSECVLPQAHAGQWAVEGSVGAAFPRPTVYDGTFRQDGVQPPNFRLMDQAWSIGFSYRINHQWSIQGHRFDWGSAAVKSRFVSDQDYDPVNSVCLANCQGTYNKVLDRMWGYDLTASRYWPITDAVEGYLKGGGAIAFHELKWGDGNTYGPTRFNGAIPMLVLGGGLCYGPLCFDTTLYQGTPSMNSGCIGGGQYECGYPLSKQVVVSALLVKIPIPH